MKHGKFLLLLLCLVMVLATVLTACSPKDEGPTDTDGTVTDGSTSGNNNNHTSGETTCDTTGGDTSGGRTGGGETDQPGTNVPPSFEGLEYRLKDDNTYEISDYNPERLTSHVLIPETYEEKAVTSIGNMAFYYCRSLTSITIPASVRSIGFNAFYCAIV